MTVNNDRLFSDRRKILSTAQASKWASKQMKRNVTPANISSLIKYGSIVAINKNGSPVICISDLEKYYKSVERRGKRAYQNRLGKDLNWHLSFEEFKEAETTKHVHRLHAYKGKFIPQLVQYFIDRHIDEFKTEACFAPGDILLDPFCGSGTTLVQANELGMHAIGIDVSIFNAMISNLKLSSISMTNLATAISNINDALLRNEIGQRAREFEAELINALKAFNAEFFPAPIFRQRIQKGEIDEERYGRGHAKRFRSRFYRLLRKHNVNNNMNLESNQFIERWFMPSVKNEIDMAKRIIEETPDALLRGALRMILSRTARSSRATTHSDLTTLSRQVKETYYCSKHSKICKPIFSMLGWWKRYASDTLKRKALFEKLRTDSMQTCLTGDSRSINILSSLGKANSRLAALAKQKKIQGIFSSPPYVGMIDYHEQHAYAYELFDLPRNDHSEIGPMKSGQGKLAREAYADGIVAVLRNCLKYMAKDCDIFLVANDKFGLYPGIVEHANLTICKEYKRPVLNRSEGDKGVYSETIFHLKRKQICLKKSPLKTSLNPRCEENWKTIIQNRRTCLFHTRLLGKDRMALYSFIHSLSSNFGTAIFEQAAKEIADGVFDKVRLQHKIKGTFSSGAQKAIAEIMNGLSSGKREPNHAEEIAQISARAQLGKPITKRLRSVDIYLTRGNSVFLLDLKTAKPNVGGFEKHKQDMLEWSAAILYANLDLCVRTVIAMPYNPYEPKPYTCWTLRGMLEITNQNQLMVGREFWNFLAGKDVYSDLLHCFKNVGYHMRQEIDDYFKRIGKWRYR